MKPTYTVSPVQHQPQWYEDAPEPLQYPWRASLLAVAIFSLTSCIVVTGLVAAFRLVMGV